jgi:hypothetical protein
MWTLLAIGYALVASRFTPLTWPAMLATLPPAALLCWATMRRPIPAAPAVRLTPARVMPWIVVVATGLAWELVALQQAPRRDYPTLSSIISPLAGDVAGWYRFAGYLVWFAAGAWLARR